MRLRALALVTEAYGGRGGIAQYNRDLLEALAECEHVDAIDVLPRFAAAEHVSPIAKVSQRRPRSGRVAYSAAALQHAARQRSYDVVFCGHLYMAPLAAFIARRLGAKLWLQLHGIEAWEAPSTTQRGSVEQSAVVTVVSRHTRRKALSWCNVTPERMVVLPNTVDDRFAPGADPVALRERLGLGGKRTLLTVSRLAASERYKGHDRVVEAMATLRVAHPDLVYLIAGEGDDRPRLEASCRRAGVEQAVRFLGYVPDEDLPDLYRLADAYVMPSTGEGFGIVFLQAQRCGAPLVAGKRDASADPLRDGAAGILVDEGSPAELVDAIERCLVGDAPTDFSDVFSREHFRRHVLRIVERYLVSA